MQTKGFPRWGILNPKVCGWLGRRLPRGAVATDGWLKIIDIIDHAGNAATGLAPLVASGRVDMFVEQLPPL